MVLLSNVITIFHPQNVDQPKLAIQVEQPGSVGNTFVDESVIRLTVIGDHFGKEAGRCADDFVFNNENSGDEIITDFLVNVVNARFL